ncbi:low molecular weight phosphotyrosine protein phosphatase [Luteimonas aestuarii]|uniref:protein-tyrosine-phosphatase n=1 Tax=Luteimonas aestuarii TaxID=453837 RepID=A0A4V3AN07_9GAMM|nr:low molecular weight protein-tyrosine-phosphatase [Luteimonas aestuarii]TDK28745.1 low molecular weight phosphotyrosine protein phosphatase [Luteimonas aestuarii]
MRLLVVCLGNICRSPMAEGALRFRLQQAGLGDRVQVDSAGTGDWHVDEPPDRRAIATAASHGVDISTLRGRQLHVDDFQRFDWLLCADRTNLREVRARAPRDARAEIVLLREWAGEGTGAEIADPYTGGQSHFDTVWAQVDAAARHAAARFSRQRRPG